jgi:glycolate oxidase iron-sulfur subunit
MQTRFTDEQLAEPRLAEANAILRACVHCGFCTATCPTYVELGDERDSPRGRIYLIKEMLESGGTPDRTTTTHVDRCLSCLSCMTTCPSGVDYMHLVDLAREKIHEAGVRPLADRWMRAGVGWLLPRPWAFRVAVLLGGLVRPLLARLPGRFGAMGRLIPSRVAAPSAADCTHTAPATGQRVMRVALLPGCVQQVLRPAINESALRVLQRLGAEVAVLGDVGCCGALVHHLGRAEDAASRAKQMIEAVERADAEGRVDAVAITASGCGAQVKDIGHLLAGDPAWAARAADLSARAKDISEVLSALAAGRPGLLAEHAGAGGGQAGGKQAQHAGVRVAYHSACALQHGQRITKQPQRLLKDAGFTVTEPAEAHLCCGSAGTYNIMQPAMAARLKARKAGNLAKLGATVTATGNIGCLHHLAGALDGPIVHTVELLDWATGGPRPAELDVDARTATPR